MAHRKAGGTARNLRDSNPQYLGTKLYAGEKAKVGNIIVRQRGTRIMSGPGTDMGKDHTIFAIKVGVVAYTDKRHTRFDGKVVRKKMAHVVAIA